MWAAPAFNRVTAAFDDSPGGHEAVAAAAEITRATRRRLRVVTVFSPAPTAGPWLHPQPGFTRLDADAEREARAALRQVADGLPQADAALVAGDPAEELVRESEIADLLVIGSRGYGPDGVVVLGDVGDAVLRNAACPVLILPRGAGPRPLGSCGKVLMHSAA
jgi:nucleotide-binding universal stress UspA family protein